MPIGRSGNPKDRRRLQEVKPVTGNLPTIVPWDDTGREVLKKGNRMSVGNDPLHGIPENLKQILVMMQLNLDDRKKRGEASPGLGGLFGGKNPRRRIRPGMRSGMGGPFERKS